MTRATRLVPLVILSMAFAPSTQAQGRANGKREPIDPAGIARLIADSGGNAQVSVHEATGAARFVRTAPGKALGLLKQAERAASADAKKDRSARFFEAYGSVFGIADASGELEAVRVAKDRQGGTHITYRQVYRGLPVFGGQLRSHFDAADELVAVNGTFVPEIVVDPNPRRTAEEAGKTALAKVEADSGQAGKLSVAGTTLLVFREGLAQGVPGPNHLAWQVEVGDGASVREFVYVDAHTGKFVDQITGIQDGLFRRAYNAQGLTAPGPNYPANPFWVEGQPLPTGTTEADNMIYASKETYDLFSNAFGRDSFDASGGIMDSIFNRGNGCPNASWNGLFISFCPGTTTDDVTAHEWGHAYTQYTDNLIYQWQPGALNESYSDIWGETVDRINGRGLDAPGGPRTTDSCTAFTRLPGELVINSPAGIAGVYAAQAAQFGPNLTSAGTTADVVLALDPAIAGSPSPTDACSPLTNAAAVAGKIALVDRGTCNFSAKVYNAQLAGAIGVIVANNVAPGLPGMGAGVNAALVTIPSLGVTLATGNSIKANLAGGVN
ncbi:MAG TPA: PA domain-containing protein, partial [Vicinamibacteria bacterium]